MNIPDPVRAFLMAPFSCVPLRCSEMRQRDCLKQRGIMNGFHSTHSAEKNECFNSCVAGEILEGDFFELLHKNHVALPDLLKTLARERQALRMKNGDALKAATKAARAATLIKKPTEERKEEEMGNPICKCGRRLIGKNVKLGMCSVCAKKAETRNAAVPAAKTGQAETATKTKQARTPALQKPNTSTEIVDRIKELRAQIGEIYRALDAIQDGVEKSEIHLVSKIRELIGA